MTPATGRKKPTVSYTAWHELRQFATQVRLQLSTVSVHGHTLHRFPDGHCMVSDLPSHLLPRRLHKFITEAATFIESNDESIAWESGGPAIDGVGLERHLIADYLRPAEPPLTWSKDIIGILSFFSQTAQRRYEQSTPQLTVEYSPVSAARHSYGQLGKPLLDEYRAFLRLCRDARTIIRVTSCLSIIEIKDNVEAGFLDGTVPSRLSHLQSWTRESPDVVVFNLNKNGSQEIFASGSAVFRQVNGQWRLLLVNEALIALREALGVGSGEEVARNAVTLALDLADAGEGALLILCQNPTKDVLEGLFVGEEGLMRDVAGEALQELPSRTRFTQLVGHRALSLCGRYSTISPLLRDICGIDGGTAFTYQGELLGFGCLVRQQPSRGRESAPEGARTTAAKQASETGAAIKVSSDGTSTLFIRGKEWGVLW